VRDKAVEFVLDVFGFLCLLIINEDLLCAEHHPKC
jgi:hypothetical protein